MRTFLAVSRSGSLSAAARTLGITQTTVGRRLEGMHSRAGVTLLQRTPSGFILTSAGERILANVERMEAEALTAERAIAGEDERLEGIVRVTTVDIFGSRIIAPSLVELQRRYPGIAIELTIDSRSLNLSRREADIAVRMANFDQQDIVVRKIGCLQFGIFASSTYLARRGTPDFTLGCPGHQIITVQEDQSSLPEARWLGEMTHAAAIVLRTNSRDAHLRATMAGLGLCGLAIHLGSDDTLARLSPPTAAPMRDIWLGVHRDTSQIPRVRVVLDHLSETLRRSPLRRV
ncbi:MAG: LysR family transcriptional regulator [Azospirillaceae bacterium]|nr:LysR family transcriptional regulator [Azospirillaceae bacterium]